MRFSDFFKRIIPVMTLAGFILLLPACKSKGIGGNFPSDFSTMSDSQKVAYLMENATPDSVARFLCNATLERIPGVKIDSLSTATLYAYNHYKGDDVAKFQTAFDEYADALSPAPRMKLLFKAGTEDPVRLGYMLGLDYVSQIREENKSVAQVEEDLKQLKAACGSDTETYDRFIQGFKIALREDRGKDLPEAIYQRFANY